MVSSSTLVDLASFPLRIEGKLTKYKILIVEDESAMRDIICTFVERQGHQALSAEDCASGDRVWNTMRPDAAVLDYSLPDGNALDLLSRWKSSDPHIPVIILTGNTSIDLAVRAIKLGAEQFLTKPADLSTLYLMLERAIENERNRQRQLVDTAREKRHRMDPFLGTSLVIRKLAELAAKVVPSESPILITGETGTGKGVLAHWIHENGPRKAHSFVDLNCGGLSRELLESELFGHEKGAFTGAIQTKLGLLEIAHRGTVFLDEIGDIEIQQQPRLLKVLEEKQFRRLGSVRDKSVDIHLISATHNDLMSAVREQKFRGDLYFRISTIPLTIPPLRDRVEDIPTLTKWILQHLAVDLGGGPFDVTPTAVKALEEYSWPGNIRELRNVLERAVLLSEGSAITPQELYFVADPLGETKAGNSVQTLEELVRKHIEEVLRTEKWRVEEAAKKLGIPRSSLYHRIRQYGLSRQDIMTA
jgi:DNA-binding NtrC family response regulator